MKKLQKPRFIREEMHQHEAAERTRKPHVAKSEEAIKANKMKKIKEIVDNANNDIAAGVEAANKEEDAQLNNNEEDEVGDFQHR